MNYGRGTYLHNLALKMGKKIIFFVLIFTGGIVGFLIYSSVSTSSEKQENKMGLSLKETPKISIEWKLFRSEDVGFEFEYPQNWSVSEKKTERRRNAIIDSSDDSTHSGIRMIVMNLGTKAEVGMSSLEEWVDDTILNMNNHRVISRQEFNLPQGIHGVRVFLQNKYDSPKFYYEQLVFMEKDEVTFYQIDITLPKDVDLDFFEHIYQHILSTFNPI